MKRFCFAFLVAAAAVLVVPHAVAQSEWEWRNPLPQGNTLTDVCFVDATTVVAVGYGGSILWSTDAGVHWEVRPTGLRGGYNALEATADGQLLFSWKTDRLLRCSGDCLQFDTVGIDLSYYVSAFSFSAGGPGFAVALSVPFSGARTMVRHGRRWPAHRPRASMRSASPCLESRRRSAWME